MGGAAMCLAPVAQRIEHLTTDQKVRGSNPFGRARTEHRVTCANRVREHRFRKPHLSGSAQIPAQILFEGALAGRGAPRRDWPLGRRPPVIGQSPPVSRCGGDPLRPSVLPSGNMDANADTRTLIPTAADTLLLTLDEAARQLRCARRSVERQIAKRRLRVVHLGRAVRVERDELERFVANMRDTRDG